MKSPNPQQYNKYKIWIMEIIVFQNFQNISNKFVDLSAGTYLILSYLKQIEYILVFLVYFVL